MMPFVLLNNNNTDKAPHRFELYGYNQQHAGCWESVVNGCLESWKLIAEAFYERMEETGFQKIGLGGHLNAHGAARLPPTPPEDNNVTRVPCITDLTEVLAVQFLRYIEPDLILPCPRVLHKEAFPLQHHGIDIIGYRKIGSGYVLYVAEVKATVETESPPSAAYKLVKQLYDETLNQIPVTRLLDDICYVHAECREQNEKDVINGFISAILSGAIRQPGSVIACPIVVKRTGEAIQSDTTPFLTKLNDFENAHIPSTIFFSTIECHETFSGLLDLVKGSAI